MTGGTARPRDDARMRAVAAALRASYADDNPRRALADAVADAFMSMRSRPTPDAWKAALARIERSARQADGRRADSPAPAVVARLGQLLERHGIAARGAVTLAREIAVAPKDLYLVRLRGAADPMGVDLHRACLRTLTHPGDVAGSPEGGDGGAAIPQRGPPPGAGIRGLHRRVDDRRQMGAARAADRAAGQEGMA